MAGSQFVKALNHHVAWSIPVLHLRDHVYGKTAVELTHKEAQRAAVLINERGLHVYSLVAPLFHEPVEHGEDYFRKYHLDPLKHVLEIADILKPRVVCLLSPATAKRGTTQDAVGYVKRNHRWLFPLYHEAVDRIDLAGFQAAIENESGDCILGTPAEILDFFAAQRYLERVRLAWDVANLWHCGVFPTLTVYQNLKPLIGCVHVAGGQHGLTNTAPKWRSALDEASWPVADIVRQIARDRSSPVICLEPSCGKPKPGHDGAPPLEVERDLKFLRDVVASAT
jgi:hypothetical protein